MDFNKIYQLYRDDILRLSKNIVKSTNNYRIELDDLIQESNIKLWQLFKNHLFIDDKSKTLIAIKNHLLDYIRLCKKDALRNAISLDEKYNSTR